MANNKKRVLSLLMAAVMMLGTIPMNAFAFNSNNAASETRLVCENEKHHDHTSACGHKHNALCRLPQTSCYKRFRLACDHRGYHCGKSSEALECGFEAHNSNCYAAVEGDQKVDVNIDNILGNRELGVKIGKVITALTGLNAEKAASKNVLVRTALISAVQLSGLSKSQKNEVIGIIKSDENGMLSVIRWLWPTYTVQFVVDGVVVECDTVAHGAMPSFDSEEPAKTADAQYAYTFAGWNAEFAPVTGDVTYTAQFTEAANKYTVTFTDGDTVLYSEELDYGTEIVAPELPTKSGWVAKWNCEIPATVEGELNAEVVWNPAVFDSHKLRVFVGYGKSATDSTKGWFETTSGTICGARHYDSYDVNGQYIGSSVMEEGVDYVDYTATPGNIEVNGVTYTNGKDRSNDFYVINEYIMVATDAEYHLDCHATLYHTVTFEVDGETYKVDVLKGTAAECPVIPEKEGYTFTGWDKDFSKVNGSMTVTAQFEENKPAVYENVKVKLTVNGETRKILTLENVEHGTVITSEWLHEQKQLDVNCYIANDVVIDRAGDFSVEFVDTNVTLVFWNGTDKMKTVTLLVANGIEITNQWLYDNNLLDSNYVLDENAAFEKVIDEAGEYNIFVRAK